MCPLPEAVIKVAQDPGSSAHGWTPSGRCVIFVCDIIAFGRSDRVDHIQRHLRQELYARLSRAFDDAGTPFGDCYHENRGDGAIVIPPPRTTVATMLSPLIELLDAELRRQNEVASSVASIRLRVALHSGEVHPDDHGIAGTAVNHAFRLLEAPAFKHLVEDSRARLSVIVSNQVYDDVIRHAMGLIDPVDYQHLEIESKETRTTGWVRLLGASRAELANVTRTEMTPTVPRSWTRPPTDRQLDIDMRTDGAAVPDVSLNEQFEIVEQLLELPFMGTERGRDQVVGALRGDISRMIHRHSAARLDTYSIVRTCLDHPGGIQELLTTIHRFAGDATPLQRIERIVGLFR